MLERMPEKTTYLSAIVWPWHVFTADRQILTASLINHLGKRPPTVMIRHLPAMESPTRRQLIQMLAGLKKWDDATRAALLALVGDASITVREAALNAMAKYKVSTQEAVGLEELLSRKPADLRRGVLALLQKQKDKAALASAERLLAALEPLQRQAGQELLRQLTEAKRIPKQKRGPARKS
jgi:hypothetical protein